MCRRWRVTVLPLLCTVLLVHGGIVIRDSVTLLSKEQPSPSLKRLHSESSWSSGSVNNVDSVQSSNKSPKPSQEARSSASSEKLEPRRFNIPLELATLFTTEHTPFSEKRRDSSGSITLADVSRLNFTAIQLEIDFQLAEMSRDPVSYQVNRRGRMLPTFISQTVNLFDIKQVWREIETSVMSSVSCTACKAGVGLLQHYVNTGRSRSEIVHAAIKLCRNLHFESPRVCEGIIDLFADEVLFVFERIALSPDEICGMAVGDVCAVPYNPWQTWTVPLPAIPKPPGPPPEPNSDAPTSRVLHISDTHFDPYYRAGSNAECGEPLCCRETSGKPRRKKDAAGYWGDYRRCDTPRRTIEHMLKHISDVHGKDLDYIIWTGDLPPHDVWNQSRHENINIIRQSHQMLTKFFPKTRIFPSLGNHEAAPVNSFPPPFIGGKYSISWLYDELDREWSTWLPDSVSTTVRRGAFYSTPVRPGLRIVSLNMNYCNNKNWWLLLNSTDPAEELSWLVYELQVAELKGEKVHILGHIPPGHTDCLAVWSRNYYHIVNRFSRTITGQFFGHTHYDEYQLFYDLKLGYLTNNVAYMAPSVTSYFHLNPGYRIYHVDTGPSKLPRLMVSPGSKQCLPLGCEAYSATVVAQFFGHTHYDEFSLIYNSHGDPLTSNASAVMYISPSVTPYFDLNLGYRLYDIDKTESKMVVDHETWIMDLDRANRLSYPQWFFLYSARQAYGLTSLAPSQWDRLVNRMSQDDQLFQQYYRYYMKASPVRPACDEACKKRLLCDIVSGRSNARQVTCKRLNQKFEAQERSGWMSWMTSSVGITAGVVGTLLLGVPLVSMYIG